MAERVARAICASLEASGALPHRAKDANDPWAFGPAYLAARAVIREIRPDIVKLLKTATVNMPPETAERLVDAALSLER